METGKRSWNFRRYIKIRYFEMDMRVNITYNIINGVSKGMSSLWLDD